MCAICGYDESRPRSAMFLRHGTLLADRYRVGRVLGRPGGFGITYLAWDVHLQQRVAIKEYLPRELANRDTDRLTVSVHTADERGTFEAGREQFLREARIVAGLNHPNIVRVLSYFNAHGTAYLVMDYYEGLSMGDYLATVSSVLDPVVAVGIIEPVLEGLAFVHQHGVVHRDIKPHNLYLAAIGKPILLDFGAATVQRRRRAQYLGGAHRRLCAAGAVPAARRARPMDRRLQPGRHAVAHDHRPRPAAGAGPPQQRPAGQRRLGQRAGRAARGADPRAGGAA